MNIQIIQAWRKKSKSPPWISPKLCPSRSRKRQNWPSSSRGCRRASRETRSSKFYSAEQLTNGRSSCSQVTNHAPHKKRLRMNDSIQPHLIQMTKNIDAHVLQLFRVGELMGSGAYGHVWKVESRDQGKSYALKKVFGAFRNSVDAQRTYRQVEILKQVRHKNIIKLQRVIGASNREDLYLLFQLMEADLLAVVGSNILSPTHQKFVLFQIATAIAHLHQLLLIHRDLKPSNVLLDSNCTVKICDFGLVRKLDSEENDHQILSQEVATKWYRAPQLLLGSRSYGFPIDLWSFGCIAAELLTGKTLFAGGSTLQQLEKIIQFSGHVSQEDLESLDSPVAQCLISQIHPKIKLFSDYFSLVDPEFYPLLRGLLQFNPHKRLTASQCLQLQLFQQFKQPQKEGRIQKPVQLNFDDNLRYSTKQYRNQIYANIPKQEIAKEHHKSPLAKNVIGKYKSLTKFEEKQSPHKPNNLKVVKNKSVSHSVNIRRKADLIANKKDSSPKKVVPRAKLTSPILRPLSKGRSMSPYQKSAKELASVLKKSPCHFSPSVKVKVSKLKKVSRNVHHGGFGKK